MIEKENDTRKDIRKNEMSKDLILVEKKNKIQMICKFSNSFEFEENHTFVCLSTGMRVPQNVCIVHVVVMCVTHSTVCDI